MPDGAGSCLAAYKAVGAGIRSGAPLTVWLVVLLGERVIAPIGYLAQMGPRTGGRPDCLATLRLGRTDASGSLVVSIHIARRECNALVFCGMRDVWLLPERSVFPWSLGSCEGHIVSGVFPEDVALMECLSVGRPYLGVL